MNPFTFEVTCDVCGGTGVGAVRTAAAAWRVDNTVAHTDPSICRAIIETNRIETQRKLDEERDRIDGMRFLNVIWPQMSILATE